MRDPFVHTALIACAPDADLRAPGGAVTEELCGSFEHEPPCPLASHFTSSERRVDDLVEIRVLFASEPADEDAVRARIDTALGRSWDLVTSGADAVRDDEAEHAARLVTS